MKQNYKLKILVLLCLILPISSWASNFTQAITTVAETCIGNGSVTTTISNANPDVSNFTFRIYTGTTGTTLATTSPMTPHSVTADVNGSAVVTFSGLLNGTYRLETVEVDGASSTTSITPFTIGNARRELAFTASVDACTYRIPTATISTTNPGYGPYVYIIRDTGGNIIEQSAPTNATSYTFNSSLANGNYALNVTDNCGTTRVFSLTVSPPTVTYEIDMINRLGTTHKGHILASCNTVERNFRIIYKENGIARTPPTQKFPMTVTFEIPGYGGAATTTIVRTYQNSSQLNNDMLTVPFYYNQSNRVKITVNDACPDPAVLPTHTYIAPLNNRYFDLTIASSASACGGVRNLQISRIETFNYRANNGNGYQVKVEKMVNQTTVDTSYNATVSGYNFVNGVATNFKTDYQMIVLNDVASGWYRISIDDGCGVETKTIQIIGPNYVLLNQGWAACEPGNGTFHLLVDDTSTIAPERAAFLTKVIVTNAPAAFRAQYNLPATGPISYDISYLINPGTSATDQADGILFASSFPGGSYTVSYESTCNVGTHTFNVPSRLRTAYDSNINLSCTGFDIDATLTSNYGRADMYVQKYYPESGRWGHPTTGALYYPETNNRITDTNGFKITNSVTGNTPGGNNNQITVSSPGSFHFDAVGEMRVIVQYVSYLDTYSTRTFMNPDLQNPNALVYCNETLEEFVVPESEIEFNNFIVSSCAAGYDLLIDALGVNLSYQIIEKDGEPFLSPAIPQSSPLFTGLEEGRYRVRIHDTCGRDDVATVYVSDIQKNPRIRATPLCEGQSGYLFIRGFSYLYYTWYKDGVAIPGASGQGNNRLYFPNFNSANDAATYSVSISYPGSCLNSTLTYTIAANGVAPEAGTGGSVIIDINDITDPINLFSLLTGPYDNTGVWSETTNSGFLSDYIWDATRANTGIYTFQYTVDPTCSGPADVATVTIQLKGVCYKPATLDANSNNPTIVGITTLGRAGVDNGNWPMVRKGGHIALESKTKGFVINRVAFNASNQPIGIDPANWVDGMAVYDTTNNCLKIYVKYGENDSRNAWNCFTQPTCN
ncbi:MAG: hypothetical protein Q4F57_05370 [Weeksellaceae bacterium]|nr:hypothetical protein [Weeksellaceae bacterium]